MKTIISYLIILTASVLFINCSSDNENFYPEPIDPIQQENETPMDTLEDIGAVEIPGLPRRIRKYQNDKLGYWAQYNYRADGNLIKVYFGYPESSSEIFSNTYHFSSEGKLRKLDGQIDYNYYWANDLIIEADKIDPLWGGRSKIYYEYNDKGQLIQAIEKNRDFYYNEKFIYTYFEDGDLKTIEKYGDYDDTGVFTHYTITSFDGYNKAENVFLELELIPGQIAQQHFPSSMNFRHLTESGADFTETYLYKYDLDGKVIEKIYGTNRVVYEYY